MESERRETEINKLRDKYDDLSRKVGEIEGQLKTFDIMAMSRDMGTMIAEVDNLKGSMDEVKAEIRNSVGEIKDTVTEAMKQFHRHEKDSEKFKGQVRKEQAIDKIKISAIYLIGGTIFSLIVKWIFVGFGG